MDDYREYYRDRPRGEFLTRGAALASQQAVGGPDYQSLPATGSARGSLASHLDSTGILPTSAVYSVTQRGIVPNQGLDHEQLEREPRRYVAAGHEMALRGPRSKEKMRNPTILRKSNKISD